LVGAWERNGDHGFALSFLSSLLNDGDDDDDANIQFQVYFNF